MFELLFFPSGMGWDMVIPEESKFAARAGSEDWCCGRVGEAIRKGAIRLGKGGAVKGGLPMYLFTPDGVRPPPSARWPVMLMCV